MLSPALLTYYRRGLSEPTCTLMYTYTNSAPDQYTIRPDSSAYRHSGIQVGTNVHVSDLTYADDIVILSSSFNVMQGLLDAVHRHAAVVGMRITASKTKVMSALIHGEQCLLDGEPLEDVDKFKYLGSMFVANGQGTEEIRSRINLARSAFSRLQSCRWSRREIS